MCCSSRYFRAKCRADWAISNDDWPTGSKVTHAQSFLSSVTRTQTEEQQSSDEESEKRDEAIESAVDCFTECADLETNLALVKQGEKRY